MRALLDNVPALLAPAVTATMRRKFMPSYVALLKSGLPSCGKKENPSHHQITHPKVAGAAVFGVPNPDLGEEVKAVVQPVEIADAGPALAQELLSFCQQASGTV